MEPNFTAGSRESLTSWDSFQSKRKIFGASKFSSLRRSFGSKNRHENDAELPHENNVKESYTNDDDDSERDENNIEAKERLVIDAKERHILESEVSDESDAKERHESDAKERHENDAKEHPEKYPENDTEKSQIDPYLDDTEVSSLNVDKRHLNGNKDVTSSTQSLPTMERQNYKLG